MRNPNNFAAPPPGDTAPGAAATDAGAAPAASRSPAAAAAVTASGSGRRQLIAAGLILGVAVTVAVLAWHPGPARDDLAYASIAPVRDATWVGGLLDHIGWTTVLLAFPLAVCSLVRARGARLATIGSALVMVGGMFFASTYYAFTQLAWYVTEPRALSPEAGTSFLAFLDGHAARYFVPEAISFFAFDIGMLLLCGALWRARVAPRWVPIVIGVLTVGQFAVPTAALDVEQILLLVSLLPVAWLVLRPGSLPGADRT